MSKTMLLILVGVLASACTSERKASLAQQDAAPDSDQSGHDASAMDKPNTQATLDGSTAVRDAAQSFRDGSAAFDGGHDSGQPKAATFDTTAPRLTHDIIDLSGTYDTASYALGALSCAGSDAGAEDGCFTAFLAATNSRAILVDPGYLGFATALNATVYAASPGTVMDLHELETGEYELLVRTSENAVFGVEYRHVRNLQVAVGEVISAGTVLGVAGALDAMRGRVGLSVRRDQTVTQRLCPERYGDSTWVAHLTAARQANNTATPAQAWDAACESNALLCATSPCDAPENFTDSLGDVELGRTIYARDCASCHGNNAEGVSASSLLSCTYCVSPTVMANRIALDMPPEGQCKGTCANDTAAFVFFEWR